MKSIYNRIFAITIIFLVMLTLLHTNPVQAENSNINNSNINNVNTIMGDNAASQPVRDTLTSNDLSYVLVDLQNNKVLSSYNPDVERAPASTTKLLTGLVAMKILKNKENAIVKVGNEVALYGSTLGLRPGDQISVQDLLTAMYTESANDAAAALAVYASGSISSFAEAMNNYAKSLGCTHSHFVNSNGLPNPGHYTSASDLSKIASAFIKQPMLMKYVTLKQAQVHWQDMNGNSHLATVKNTNRLLGVYSGDRGLKTGTTTEAGQCLVSYVTSSDGDLLLVVLGSKQRYIDTVHLLDEGEGEIRVQGALKRLATDPKNLINSPGLY